MFQTALAPRRARSVRRPQFDRLEPRIALSDGADLAAQLVEPAPGSTLSASPARIVLSFNRPIVPDSLFMDVIVARTDAQGEYVWSTTPETLLLDAAGTELDALLTDLLDPGSYQVLISPYSGIVDYSGNFLSPEGDMIELGGFQVVRPGVTLDQALDLGLVGSTPLIAEGSLDFSDNPQDVSLFRIELDAGHFQRLGLEVAAQRDGGSLDTALCLFDAQGRVIRTGEIGLQDAPMDPYLFVGLWPGTYYVGVSGTLNLPTNPDGYDPATGSPGSISQRQPSGMFTLRAVADPVDAPPDLVAFRLDHADANDSAPTGLTLHFSRTISVPAQGDIGSALSRSIIVRDQYGTSWPVQVSAVDASQASVSYLFDDFLPPGHYLVTLPEQGGLTDLAGLAPVAANQPPGMLAWFDVQPRTPAEPLDPGALMPAAATYGVMLDPLLSPGEVLAIRFVVTVPGLYTLPVGPGAGSSRIELAGPTGTRTLGAAGSNDTQLETGEYSLRFTNLGSQAVRAPLRVRLAQKETEIVLANGVGQGPALSLRLVSFPATISDLAPTGPPSGFEGLLSVPPLPAPAEFANVPVAPLSAGVQANQVPGAGRPTLSPLVTSIPAAGISVLNLMTELVGRPSSADQALQIVPPGSLPPNTVTPGPGRPAQAGPFPGAVSHFHGALIEPQMLRGSVPGGPLAAPLLAAVRRPRKVLPPRLALLDRAGRWSLRQVSLVMDWVRSRVRQRGSEVSETRSLVQAIPAGQPPLTAVAGLSDLEVRAGRTEDAEGALPLPPPPLIVLSAVAFAQASRWLARRWKSRRAQAASGRLPGESAASSSLLLPLRKVLSSAAVTFSDRSSPRRSRAG